jgi:hypothetical protein
MKSTRRNTLAAELPGPAPVAARGPHRIVNHRLPLAAVIAGWDKHGMPYIEGVVFARHEGMEIVGNGTLPAPLMARAKEGHALLCVSDREHAAVLAGLRMWQRSGCGRATSEDDIATNGGTLLQLDAAEVDALCERLNTES